MEGLEHLDKHLVDELAQVARDAVREELREQTRKQRRTAMLYAASGAVALYAGAAVALTVGLALAIGLPDWAAALITAAILGVAAYLLRSAARPHASAHAGLAAGAGRGDRVTDGTGAPVPPVPPVAPSVGAGTPGAGAPAPHLDETGPEQSNHRA